MPEPTDQDVAEASAAHLFDRDLASRSLGIRLLAVAPGTGEASMTVRDDMVNGYGICHGGLIATLADSAFAAACNSYGQMTVAAGFEITFLQSAQLGDELVASAHEVALRGRSGLYDVTVRRRADAVVIAEFRGRSRSLGRPVSG